MLDSIPKTPKIPQGSQQNAPSKLRSRDSRYSEQASGSQYTKIFNVLGILICYIWIGYTEKILNISRCSGNNFKITLNSNIQGKLWKIRYVRSVYMT